MNGNCLFIVFLFVSSIQAWDLTYNCATATFIKAEEYASSVFESKGISSLIPSNLPTLPVIPVLPSSFSGYFNASSTGSVVASSVSSGAAVDTTGATGATTSTTSSSTSLTSSLSTFASQILEEHNKKRALHGSPPLTWSSELADFAQNYVDTGNDACAGSLEHSQQYYGKSTGYGENLALGYSYTGAVDAWYDEISNYDYADPDASTGTIGHFTQVVWNTTTELGCGYKYCSPVWDNYIVCEYYPPGNFVGQYAQHVPPLLE